MCFNLHIFKMELIQQNLQPSGSNIWGDLSNTYPSPLITHCPETTRWDPVHHIWPMTWLWILGYGQWTKVDNDQVHTSQKSEFDLKSTGWSCKLEMRQLRTMDRLALWSQEWRQAKIESGDQGGWFLCLAPIFCGARLPLLPFRFIRHSSTFE